MSVEATGDYSFTSSSSVACQDLPGLAKFLTASFDHESLSVEFSLWLESTISAKTLNVSPMLAGSQEILKAAVLLPMAAITESQKLGGLKNQK